jgi:hypothetical protein
MALCYRMQTFQSQFSLQLGKEMCLHRSEYVPKVRGEELVTKVILDPRCL